MPKLSKLRLMRSLCSFVLLCSACSPNIPDVYVFESLDQYLATDPTTGHLVLKPSPACMAKINEVACGHGVAIVSGTEIYVGELPGNQFSGKSWGVLKAESVYLPAQESYAPLITYIINACKKMNCSSVVGGFTTKLNTLGALQGPKGAL